MIRAPVFQALEKSMGRLPSCDDVVRAARARITAVIGGMPCR
jgi:hypothetical protein